MRYLVIIVMAILVTSCNSSGKNFREEEGLSSFSSDSLATYISALSSDSFQGRKPFTDGETITTEYLKQHFVTAGLEPGSGDSYFQEVPMINITSKASPIMQVQSDGNQFSLTGREDYVIWSNKTDTAVSLLQDEIVFAGYGVVAPEYGWNDYEGLNVKGKIVLVMVNDPGFALGDSALFKGKTMTYYGRWTYKFEEAARQGAKACLVIHNTEAASYPFAVVQNNWNISRLQLDIRGKEEQACDIVGWISGPAAQKLLKAAGKDASIMDQASINGFRGMPLAVRLTTSIQNKTTYNLSKNVIGKITGSQYPEETIIYSAHWDHLGIGAPDEKGDSIYNGAVDNAGSVAGLIELARAFKSMKTSPERTVIFLAVTAEEQGLLGSAYYAQHPVYPTQKTVANINMDDYNWYGKTRDIVVIGLGQSELEEYLGEEAAKVGRIIVPEQQPEAGFYYRSDHFNFARVGIPSLYTGGGMEVIGKDSHYGKKANEEYTAHRYHRPSDEFDPETWNLDAGIHDLQLLFRLGRRLAYGHEWPQWKPGSEFKAVREKH